MSAVIQESSPYERLLALPENLVGEIIGRELYTQPGRAGPHASVAPVLGIDIGSAYHRGRGGPGGWWIIDEPEFHFVRDTEVLVPDIAGWRRERMSSLPEDHRFEVVPDWVCEILSPTPQKKDRVTKTRAYARYGVAFLWLVDPLARISETYALADGQWTVTGLYQDHDEVSAAPFEAVTIALSDLWAGS
ncbi:MULTISPECIES: Uma2 family endonuclease [Methylocaldum]|jgi:Uma2 family endonuclease|uniref:Uma2 family endonuclease n=1 Tax=unclassified Methylocaldum TaxID=2622260 RepID=UPI00098BB357|nr:MULTISPECIES: Uma2 family endonuclease [unclassified Methylocaldum]MBP1149478.1 Uma2 family endonuclease [Methylocaldum sp. RMAD-M]MDV3243011.1 Uma2 family endonuclease [Methylocaldum sp.]MVF23488.1 Uma2 family endonuclease [Methylocaldum sp. BRCS4]